ncbi:MAG: ABC transporter ATP-binding protein [Candidatus Thermoplasmatota archaeon]|nr:ABC transporter ATP-binding protein [Candidatus Thermoplasmatota archaeon]
MSFIEMHHIRKVYPDGTEALKDVDLTIEKGEIHGLLGENGAGKTTLMKILSGLLQPTGGSMTINGSTIRLKDPRDALSAGIGMVHQHFSLVPTFDALQNIVLGYEGSKGRIRREKIEKGLDELMSGTKLRVPLDKRVELLTVGAQQKVEILKLLYRDVDLLILDEPTSILGPLEIEDLIRTIRDLKEQGKTIVLITHKLKEIMDITERITVLRNGIVSGRIPTAEAEPEILAKLMVGEKEIPKVVKERSAATETMVSISKLRVKNDLGMLAFKDESFDIKKGEIFGIAGVEGNGQKELVEAITGLRKPEKGSIELNGLEVTKKSTRELYELGLAHVPEDRMSGLILEFSISENLMLGKHRSREFLSGIGSYDWKKIDSNARAMMERFSILAPGTRSPTKSLSGGNQQKVIVAREASRDPAFIVAVQPTKGLDIGATQYIRELLVSMSREGRAILLVSMDLDEILELSDRIAVIYEGKFVGVGRREEMSREKIGMLMGGVNKNGD